MVGLPGSPQAEQAAAAEEAKEALRAQAAIQNRASQGFGNGGWLYYIMLQVLLVCYILMMPVTLSATSATTVLCYHDLDLPCSLA